MAKSFVTLIGDLNRDSYGEPEVDTPLYTDFTPSEADTIFDLLTARGVSWDYFEQRASMMRAFTKYTFDMVRVREYDDPSNGFAVTVAKGLSGVTFIDPLFGDLPAGVGSPQDNDDAPPSDLADGQNFIQGIVDTLFDPSSTTALSRPRYCAGSAHRIRRPSDQGLRLADLRAALPLASPRDNIFSPLGTGAHAPRLRSVERRFKVPHARDAHGAFLGGLALTLGTTPRR